MIEEQCEMKALKEQINFKKKELNCLAKMNLKENKTVKLSKELDTLINKYYLMVYDDIYKYQKI